jgi:hypothetical protein
MASGSGTSLWKPVFLTIACLNILAVGGLLYSAPWTHKAEEAELQANLEKQAIARKLLLPEKVTAKQFLANAPAALRKKLLKELEDDAIRSALKGVESDEVAGAKDDADDDSKSASEADHGKVASS